MSILTRYIARTFLRNLIFTGFTLVSLVLVATFFGRIETVFSSWASLRQFLEEAIHLRARQAEDRRAAFLRAVEESFGIMFDERYEGKIAWVDTLNMLTVGGLYLGVADPYQMTDDELVQVRDFLIAKKPLVRFLWNQSYDFWLAFKKEEVWAGYAWPDTVGYADGKGMNYKYMKPKEGRISWVCGMGLFADTDNYFHAHEYVDSWASTKAAEFLLAYYYYGHTNTEADLSVVPPGLVDALGLDDPTVLDPPNAIPESYMPRRELYAQYWAEVLAS